MTNQNIELYYLKEIEESSEIVLKQSYSYANDDSNIDSLFVDFVFIDANLINVSLKDKEIILNYDLNYFNDENNIFNNKDIKTLIISKNDKFYNIILEIIFKKLYKL